MIADHPNFGFNAKDYKDNFVLDQEDYNWRTDTHI